MKYFPSVAALAVVAVAALTPPAFAADVGVSISIGQPGFYGRLDIGDFPPPQLLYRQPMIIEHDHGGRPPIYLRVPPGHAKHWRDHCHEYNACGERVYFVQDGWYNREYVPLYQRRHENWQKDIRKGRDERDNHQGNHQNSHQGNASQYGRKDKDYKNDNKKDHRGN